MKQSQCTVAVDVSPNEVDAGAEVTLKVSVTGLSKGIRQPSILVRELDGGELARTLLRQADSGEFASDDIMVAAPRDVGERVWRVIAVATDNAGAQCEQAAAEVRFAVRPHTQELNVWDVPSAIVAGEPFKFKVGIRCSSACSMSGQQLRITERSGREVTAARFGENPWPGTEALYAADIEATAPAAAGNHEWDIRAAACDLALPHAAGAAQMRFRVVNPPDCLVTVEVFDREKQTPVAAARVVMTPYRATTDAEGVARVWVTKGQYDLLVARSKYTPVSIPIDVRADLVARAELETEPPLESLDEG